MRTELFRPSRPLAAASLVALGLLSGLTACGGKNNKTEPNTAATRNPQAQATVPEGFWRGTLKTPSGRAVKANCLVLVNGETRVVAKGHLLMAFHLDHGKGEGHYMDLGLNTLHPGQPKVAASLTVTDLHPQKSFSGVYQVGDAQGSFTFDAYEAGYDKNIEIAALAGQYTGAGEMRTICRLEAPRGLSLVNFRNMTLVLGGDGSLSGGDADNFHLQGAYRIPIKGKAGITFAFTYTPAEGRGVVEQFKGMGVVGFDQGRPVLRCTALGEHDGLIEGTFNLADAP